MGHEPSVLDEMIRYCLERVRLALGDDPTRASAAAQAYAAEWERAADQLMVIKQQWTSGRIDPIKDPR